MRSQFSRRAVRKSSLGKSKRLESIIGNLYRTIYNTLYTIKNLFRSRQAFWQATRFASLYIFQNVPPFSIIPYQSSQVSPFHFYFSLISPHLNITYFIPHPLYLSLSYSHFPNININPLSILLPRPQTSSPRPTTASRLLSPDSHSQMLPPTSNRTPNQTYSPTKASSNSALPLACIALEEETSHPTST